MKFFTILVSLFAASYASAQYTLTDLGSLGGGWSEAFAINNAGHIVGHAATSTGIERAFFWDGVMHDLGTLENGGTRAYAINDTDQLAGSSDISIGFHAFSYANGTMSDLGTLGGNDSTAHGINNTGRIAGSARLANGSSHAVLWEGTNLFDIGTLGGDESGAADINNVGQVVGNSKTSDDQLHSFIWSSSQGMIDLGLLGTYTVGGARAVNDRGVVVGSCNDSVAFSQAFWWDGTIHPLPRLPGSDFDVRTAEAWAINSSNQIVGYSQFFNGVQGGYRAVMWNTDGQITSLSPFLPGWSRSFATGINDSGQIVGMGTNPQGNLRGFLLTPVPEPTTIAVIGIGLLAVVKKRRRSK